MPINEHLSYFHVLRWKLKSHDNSNISYLPYVLVGNKSYKHLHICDTSLA
jgi:hypothetical protein